MPPSVLIIPDKFKGTLTADEAATAIAQGWKQVRPEDELQLLPMSDGGDGFGEIISRLLTARAQTVATVDAAHRRTSSRWWWEPRTRTAVIESAKVIGLAMLPAGKFHPFNLDTFGLGKVLDAAAKRGCRHCLIGIGGSATNDGGFGLARALGWRFLDQDDRTIERWTALTGLARLVPPTVDAAKRTAHPRRPGSRVHSSRPARRPFECMQVTVAVDVQNPLLGARGASRVYGPQKGLRPEDFPLAEECLRRLALITKGQFHRDYARMPGAGAAGGLGFGLFAFLGARAASGVALFARYAHLSRRLEAADLVITGEGAIDQSTWMGKGVGDIACRCRRLGIPCIGVAGVLNDQVALKRRFTKVYCLTPQMTTPHEARHAPAFWLTRLAKRVAQRWRNQ